MIKFSLKKVLFFGLLCVTIFNMHYICWQKTDKKQTKKLLCNRSWHQAGKSQTQNDKQAAEDHWQSYRCLAERYHICF